MKFSTSISALMFLAYNFSVRAFFHFFVYRKLDESEAVSLLDISVQNLTFLPARLFQVSLLVTTVNPLIPRLVTHFFSKATLYNFFN